MNSSVKPVTKSKAFNPSSPLANSAWSKGPPRTTTVADSRRAQSPANSAPPSTHSHRQSTLGLNAGQQDIKPLSVSQVNSISFESIRTAPPTTPQLHISVQVQVLSHSTPSGPNTPQEFSPVPAPLVSSSSYSTIPSHAPPLTSSYACNPSVSSASPTNIGVHPAITVTSFVLGIQPRTSISVADSDENVLSFTAVVPPSPTVSIRESSAPEAVLLRASQPEAAVKLTRTQMRKDRRAKLKQKEQEEKDKEGRETERTEVDKKEWLIRGVTEEEIAEIRREGRGRFGRESERGFKTEARTTAMAKVEAEELTEVEDKPDVAASLRISDQIPDEPTSKLDRGELLLAARAILEKPGRRREPVIFAILRELSTLIIKAQPDLHTSLCGIVSHLVLEKMAQRKPSDSDALFHAMLCRRLMLFDLTRGLAFWEETNSRFYLEYPFYLCNRLAMEHHVPVDHIVGKPYSEHHTRLELEDGGIQISEPGAPDDGLAYRIHLVILELYRMQILSLVQLHEYAERAIKSSANLSDCLASLSELLKASIRKVKETDMHIILRWMESIVSMAPPDEAMVHKFQAIVDLRSNPQNHTIVSSSTDESQNEPPFLPLIAARFIEDIRNVSYPSNIRPPDVHSNATSACGRFRYDRAFLLQFMHLCKAKPDRLPPLESIGLDPSKASEIQTGRRQGGRCVGPMSTSVATTIQRQTPSQLEPGRTSRLDSGGRSVIIPSPVPWSPKGASLQEEAVSPNGCPIPTTQGTGQGNDHDGSKDIKHDIIHESESQATPVDQTDVSLLALSTPLQKSPNRWTASSIPDMRKWPDVDTLTERKVRALLNKLTIDNFGSMSDQIVEGMNKGGEKKSGSTLIQVIKLVVEQAKSDIMHSEMYARLCRKMMWSISAKVQDEAIRNPDIRPITGSLLFQKYLLGQCQEDFDRSWTTNGRSVSARETDDDGTITRANLASSVPLSLSDRIYMASKARRQSLGLVRFMGELFKIQMLTERIIHENLKKLVSSLDSSGEDTEQLCVLLATVGQSLDNTWGRNDMNDYFEKMEGMVERSGVILNLRFALQDIIDLRARQWQKRKILAPLLTSTAFYYSPLNDNP